jgi:hypothetical protein
MGLTRMLLDGVDLIVKVVPRRESLFPVAKLIFFRLVLTFGLEWYVDVEDTARLHVIALLDPDVQSERIFACAAPFTWTEVLHVLRTLRPQNTTIPDPPEDEGNDHVRIVPSRRAEDLLRKFYGKPWTKLQESLARGIDEQLVT